MERKKCECSVIVEGRLDIRGAEVWAWRGVLESIAEVYTVSSSFGGWRES